jgi:tetratricopeptide (TPR) repeat protein
MKLRIVCALLSWAAVLAGGGALAADLGTISGVVRDADGRPLAGAVLTLSAAQNVVVAKHTSSDEQGRYVFKVVPTGEFQLSAALEGYSDPPPRTMTISSSGWDLESNFVLTRAPAAAAPAQDAKPAQAPPKFEAAGVRGLIDPGGYSAPANAAAASGLIKGMADIKRLDGEPDRSVDPALACGMETELLNAVGSSPTSASAKQRLGDFYLAHAQPAKGIALLEQARQLNASELGIARDLATALIQERRFDTAREILLGIAPVDGGMLTRQLLARADEGSGQFREAAEEYRLAARNDPNEENLYGVGYELILDGALADAASAFREALLRRPSSLTLLIGAGTAEFLAGHISGGVDYFLRATEIQPADPRAYAFLASASALRGPWNERLTRTFKRFVELAPARGDAAYYYALSLWNARAGGGASADDGEIEGLLMRAIQLAPDLAKAHFQLGELYFERQDYQGAVREYEIVVRQAPEMREAHYRLATAYKRAGQEALAGEQMRIFEDARDRQSGEPGAVGVDIEQFISVLAPAQAKEAGQQTCAEAKP